MNVLKHAIIPAIKSIITEFSVCPEQTEGLCHLFCSKVFNMLTNAAFCHYAQWQANCQCLSGLLLSKAAVGPGVNLLSLINEVLSFRLCQLFKRIYFTLTGVQLLILKAFDLMFCFKKTGHVGFM